MGKGRDTLHLNGVHLFQRVVETVQVSLGVRREPRPQVLEGDQAVCYGKVRSQRTFRGYRLLDSEGLQSKVLAKEGTRGMVAQNVHL